MEVMKGGRANFLETRQRQFYWAYINTLELT